MSYWKETAPSLVFFATDGSEMDVTLADLRTSGKDRKVILANRATLRAFLADALERLDAIEAGPHT